MGSQYPLDGDVANKVPNLNTTWEEDMMLRGVRPDSEVVSLLQSLLTSPRSQYIESTPAPSSALLALIESLSQGRAPVLPLPTSTSTNTTTRTNTNTSNGNSNSNDTPAETSVPKMVSPLRVLHARRSPTRKRTGITIGLTGARPRLPAHADSPPVVVVSLLPIGDHVSPPVTDSTSVFHCRPLPPLEQHSPNAKTNTNKNVSAENTPRARRRRGHPPALVAHPSSSRSTAQVRETEATPNAVDDVPLPRNWLTVDGEKLPTSTDHSGDQFKSDDKKFSSLLPVNYSKRITKAPPEKSKKVLTVVPLRKGYGKRCPGQINDTEDVGRPNAVSGGVLFPQSSGLLNVCRIK
ncbi:hypothetical protein LSM04_000648 [Trypanosoma melophagium]|uniref:uncharacterized protein n=1 Tax=Trypanosoma melophagium TaxID=715481 RepID=UPI00351A6A37|nr:hypothetical protein LSM04_000648 [Trypanosoma melophagium]